MPKLYFVNYYHFIPYITPRCFFFFPTFMPCMTQKPLSTMMLFILYTLLHLRYTLAYLLLPGVIDWPNNDTKLSFEYKAGIDREK